MKQKTDFKGFQLKHFIEQYNEKNPDKIVKGYKSKRVGELMKLVLNLGIMRDFKNYKIIEKNPYTPADIYKKAGINKYNTDDQKQYLINLNNNPRYENPLQALAQYTNKESKLEYLKPQTHQEKFIKQFIYSKLTGCVVFHGVGSGKTLTAVISSYYYLKMYPENKVIVISPSALLFNFVAGMIQYGLDKNDNRYSFFTYDKFVRNPQICKDSLGSFNC